MDGTSVMNPVVSVITAFFNEERFLQEAIESVIAQQYPDWELILVDDGSVDGSTAMARTYASRFPRKIRYIQHEQGQNRGLSASRNLGISQARGRFIAFLDADDFWMPEKLTAQTAILEAHPQVAMVCEASQYWYSWQNPAAKDVLITVGVPSEGVFAPPALVTQLYPLSTGAAPCPSGIMIRKDALEKHRRFEAQFTGKYQLYEDQAFLHKIYLNEAVYIDHSCHNKYRQRHGSLVHQVKANGDYHAVRRYFLGWLANYMAERQLNQPQVEALLAKARFRYRSPVHRWWARLADKI